MALGNTDITGTDIQNETGIASNLGSDLVGAPGLNKYSYYAPGFLSVETYKNIVLTPPVKDMKIGDFRSYNHSAIKPSILTPANSLTWGPGGAYCNFVMNYRLEALNLYAFADRGDYITMDFYASAADRTTGANLRHRQKFTIPVVGDTPLVGHTRQSASRPSTSGWIQCTITGFDTSWLGSSTAVYVDTYISTLANDRKINFGTSVTDCYSSLTLVSNQTPYLVARNTNNPTPPSGYTAIFPQISGGGVPVCSYGSTFNQSLGTTYIFNLIAKGIYSKWIPERQMYQVVGRILDLVSCDIILTLDGVRTVCASGVALNHGGGYFCNGTLAGGGTWNFNKVGEVTFENAVILATPGYTEC